MGDYYDSSMEIQCPSCKTTKYRNPQMKLMVNVCGHALCEACLNLYFIKESGQCPECEIILKRSKYRIQIFEDPLVEKEIDIRRRVMKIYNKQEDEFMNTEDWNMYLEEIEETVYNLANEIDKLDTEKKLEMYERLHRDEIRRNYSRKSKDDEELEKICDQEKIRSVERMKLESQVLKKAKILKEKNQNSLLQDLMASQGDASLIVQSYAERLRKEQQEEEEENFQREVELKESKTLEFSSGVRIGISGNTTHTSVMEVAPLYSYKPLEVPESLPVPTVEELKEKGYLQHVRQATPQSVAGGYTEHYACLRALQEFMWGHMLPVRSGAS